MESTTSFDRIRAVEWMGDHFRLIDQRSLPRHLGHVEIRTANEAAQAIRDMVVRGAPAIGIAAGYGVVLAARLRFAEDPRHWKIRVVSDLQELIEARPTAVNLKWAVERMQAVVSSIDGDPVAPLLAEAQRIHAEDIAANHKMGALGAALIEPGSAVLTHCNTGSLATGGYGTALGVVRAAFAGNRINAVYADETRPWLQGARLTAWELVQEGIPVTLLADGASALLMKERRVQWVIVGADRIAANGDAANKIGTYAAAISARYHGVKFMVVAPTSTVDLSTPNGTTIPIEQRAESEVLSIGGNRVAPDGARAWNPAFDVTPASLIDAIVTEKGVVSDPTPEKMASMMGS